MVAGTHVPSLRVVPARNASPALLSQLQLPGTHVEVFAAARADRPLCALLACEGDVVKGMLAGVFTALGYRVLRLVIMDEPDACDRVARALLGHVIDRCPGLRVEAVTRQPDQDLHAPLTAAEFSVVQERVHVRRSLLDYCASGDDPFEYHAARELGRAHLLETLSQVIDRGELGTLGMSLRDRLDTLLRLATRGNLPDLSSWRIATLNGELAGVALGQVDARTGMGMMLYLGLVPHLRGRGMGRLLHSHTLAHLRAAGATRYVDTTAADNSAMRKTFEHNGCQLFETSTLWLRSRPPRPTRLDSFAALLAFLTSDGYNVTERTEDGWLSCRMCFGGDEADVDLVWLRDIRVLQAVHVMPFVVPDHSLGAAARVVCELNRDLDLPGFILEEQPRSVRCQIPALLDERGGLAVETLLRVVTALVETVAGSRRRWHELGLVAQDDTESATEWATGWAE